MLKHLARPLIVLSALACVAAACASRTAPVKTSPPPPDPSHVAARFKSLIDEGCYLCFQDVLHQYAALGSAMRTSPVLQPIVADAALLFLMRDKELGIPVDDDWQRADEIATAWAAQSPGCALYLDVARGLPWSSIGVGEDFVDAQNESHHWPTQQKQTDWRQQLATRWPEDKIAAYVFLSLNCELRPQTPIDPTPIAQRYASSPLIQYRWGTCASSGDAALQAIAAQDPRFVETAYYLARSDARRRQYARAQHEDLQAWKGIPGFTAAALSAGDLALTAESFEEATRLYDEVLAIVPTHRRALVGRTIALSYEGLYAQAAAEARHIVALGTWNLDDGYYWMAWNEFHLQELTTALADVSTAKHYDTSARTYILAGLIRMAQKAWPEAKQEFLSARKGDPDGCDEQFYLGRVDGELATWPEAASYFSGAVACYVKSRDSIEDEIAKLKADAAGGHDRLLARRARDLKDAIAKQASSLFNAAISYDAAGDRDQALILAGQASAFPEFTDRARALEARLKKQ